MKTGPEKFHKISITDDYRKDEREEIKRWVMEAKQRTEKIKDLYGKFEGHLEARHD